MFFKKSGHFRFTSVSEFFLLIIFSKLNSAAKRENYANDSTS